MKPLDDELRDALRREEPPAGFAERVLRRVEDQTIRTTGGSTGPARQQRRPGPFGSGKAIRLKLDATWRGPRIVRWAAAAAVVGAVAGGIQYRAIQKERDERARGEAAKEQVVQALQIAGSKLQLVQAKIKGVGS